MRPSLTEIGRRLDSSKFTGHSYLPVLDELFAPLRDLPINLLELGIDRGNSMRLWLEYFPLATIHGVEAQQFASFDPRLRTYCCDAHGPAVGQLFAPASLDVIVDDCSHDPAGTLRSCDYLWPALKQGGLYVVEDLPLHAHTSEILRPWSVKPGFRIHAGFTTGFGGFRDDDVMVILRKEANP